MKLDDYAKNDPLSMIVEFLEKHNEDKLAENLLDVFANYSADIEQFNLVAKLYLDLRNAEKAEKYALKVLDMVQDNQGKYNCRANLAKMYNNLNIPEKSLYYSKLNAAIDPNSVDVLLEMVFSHYLMGNKVDSEKILRDLKAREDTLSERHRDIVNFNLGTYDMEKGEFLKGLAGFLINVKKLELWFSPKELPYIYWAGGKFPGKTLILFMEGGGIGDEFITIRWMDKLKEMGFRPVYYTLRKDLMEIFNRCGYETIMDLDNIPEDAMWTYAMQVPLWLQVTEEEVLKERYLSPSEEAREKWAFVKKSKAIKIGVRWQGNAKNERDLHRQVPLDGMMNMIKSAFPGKDVEIYSLQIGDGVELAEKYPELIDHTDAIHSYDDTFALVENLDLVITSCTSVLHAAAIMGTKTYGLIPISAYFTWLSPPLLGRSQYSSIWYGDNLKVFKQIKPKNWDLPLEQMKEEILKDLNEQ